MKKITGAWLLPVLIIAAVIAAGLFFASKLFGFRLFAANPAAGKWVSADPGYGGSITVGGMVRYSEVFGESGRVRYRVSENKSVSGYDLEFMGRAPYDSLIWHEDVLADGTKIEVLSAASFEYDGRGVVIFGEYVRTEDAAKLPGGYRSSYANSVNSSPATPTYMSVPDRLRVKDLEKTIGWLEVPLGELDLDFDGSCADSDSVITTVWIEGRLCGFDCEGFVIFIGSLEAESRTAGKVELKSYSRRDDMKEAFTKEYGEPIDGGMIPYAQSQGGAIYWSLFKTKTGYIKLMKASEYDYVQIELCKTYYDK